MKKAMFVIIPLMFSPLCAQADLEFSPWPLFVAQPFEQPPKYTPDTVIDPNDPSGSYSKIVDMGVKQDWLVSDEMLKGTVLDGG